MYVILCWLCLLNCHNNLVRVFIPPQSLKNWPLEIFTNKSSYRWGAFVTTIYKLSFSSWVHNAGSFLVIEGLGGLQEFTYEMILYLFSLLRISLLMLTLLLFKNKTWRVYIFLSPRIRMMIYNDRFYYFHKTVLFINIT